MEWAQPTYYEASLALPYPLEPTIPTGPGDVPERPRVPEKEYVPERRYAPERRYVPDTPRVPEKKPPVPEKKPRERREPRFGVETLVESFRESEDPCAPLKYFNTMLLIDDSEHMEGAHWAEVEQILEMIAPVLTKYDPNGIDMEFVNYWSLGYLLTGRRGYTRVVTADGDPEMPDNVKAVFAKASPKGRCKMDKRLRAILEDYLEEYEEQLRDTGERIRPLNLIVITSGVTDDTPYYTLVWAARELDRLGAPPYQVGIQFFQVGSEPDATWALWAVDDRMHKEEGVRDIVDTVTWTDGPGVLSPGALLKTILGAVKRSIDRMPV
ncbi:hypothetical protein F4809DRAFT_644926 [Biscogniauxia mediterranea]|nr:hypothetical protein F4809DRAFT_644926 [Biscogniauxia mediterranea]